ncbi:MAG: tail fiber protein [Chitinophagaceae bacterium]
MYIPFVGEIKQFSGDYAPKDWALCDGQLLSVEKNDVLYALIGNKFGGDGVTNFALPDLRGRVPIHASANYPFGSHGGQEQVTLNVAELPSHTHTAYASGNVIPNNVGPDHGYWGSIPSTFAWATGPGDQLMHPDSIKASGQGQPHENRVPYVAVSYIISLTGIFPNRSLAAKSATDAHEWSLGEIRALPYDFAPAQWVFCDGQSMHVNENQSLFSLIGYTYGGSGPIFKLPDLRGKALLHAGNGYEVGKGGGESNHRLVIKEMAAHKHLPVASSKPSDEGNPKHNYWPRDKPYRDDNNTRLHPDALKKAGEDQPHDNMAPYLSLHYCIAVDGDFPVPTIMEDYTGAIKPFPMGRVFEFPWFPCDGRYLPATQFPDLYKVIGNKYGGDSTMFRVPDLGGRVMIGQGKGEGLSRYQAGDKGGAAEVALTEAQLPAHQHVPSAKIEGSFVSANNTAVWANGAGKNTLGFATEPGTSPVMHSGTIGVEGEGAPHNNMMPYQVVLFSINVKGIMPAH